MRCDVTQSYSRLALERVTRCYDHNVSLAVQRLSAEAWRVSVRRVENPEIEMARLQSVAEIIQIALVYPEFDAWMFGLEASKERSEPNRTNRGHDAKLQWRPMQQTKLVGRMAGCVGLIEHLLDMRADAMSKIGEKNAPPLAMEQRPPISSSSFLMASVSAGCET
jgi:hypothetical protein